MNELALVVQFYLTGLAISVFSFFILRRWLSPLLDGGWMAARCLSLVTVSAICWWSGVLLGIGLNGQLALVVTIAFGLVALVSLMISKKSNSQWRPLDWIGWAITAETILLVVYFGWTYIRGLAPDIHSLEKFMDYGFMKSILRSGSLPPQDHFLGGEPINYYYFGQFQAAVITRLSNVSSSFSYNLQMSYIFGLISAASFSISAHLAREWTNLKTKSSIFVAGILGAAFVGWVGNSYGIYSRWFGGDPNFFYATATRFIYNTIHEYPLYSFIVNDLHGHVCNMPTVFGLLFLIALLSAKGRRWKDQLPLLSLIGFYVGASYLSNAWDLMIYLIATGLLVLVREYEELDANAKNREIVLALIQVGLKSVFLVAVAILSFLPFWIQFSPISQGIRMVTPDQRTPLWQLVVVWGTHIIPATFALFLIYMSWKLDDQWGLGEKFKGARRYATIVLGTAALCILVPELIYFKDIYPAHPRANTMFKFYYQAWIMLGLVGGASVVVLAQKLASIKGKTQAERQRLSAGRTLFLVGTGFSLIGGLFYTYLAVPQAFGNLDGNRKSVDGAEFLRVQRPEDLEFINWFESNIKDQPLILEAVGDSYTDHARIASFTGLPTVLGWPHHEWLWRGSIDQPIRPRSHITMKWGIPDTVQGRRDDVKTIYESNDKEAVRKLLERYQISYLVIGGLERAAYKVQFETLRALAHSVPYEKNGNYILKFR